MKESGPGGICFLCGSIDGRCRAGFGKNNRPLFECYYVKKKFNVDIDLFKWQGRYSDLFGYLINEVQDGATVVEDENLSIKNSISIKEIESNIPRMAEKLDILLKWLYKGNDVFESQLMTDIQPHIAYCTNKIELLNRLKALEKLGYLVIEKIHSDPLFSEKCYAIGRLTPGGVFRAEEMAYTGEQSKKVFIAMGFSTELSKSVRNGVKKGCAIVGLTAGTVDEQDYVGDINDRIIFEIKQSKYVVADYTGNNQGVYYESGFARGKGITVIETCNEDWFHGKDERGIKNKLHFDVEHRNMIFWKDEKDLAAKIRDRISSFD